jgi:hypothetical protein
MFKRSFGLLMTSLFVIILPASGADDKKKKGDDGKNDRIPFSQVGPGLIEGKVKSPPNGKSIVIEIPYQHIEKKDDNKKDNDKPNNNNNNKPNKNNNNNNKGKQSPQAIQAQQNKKIMQQQMEYLRTHKVVVDWKELEIPLDDSTKFRSKEPGTGFDDKGNIKRYSSEELKAMKGDSNLPGYEAKPEEIQAGHIVTINMAKSKTGSKLIPTFIISTGTYNSPNGKSTTNKGGSPGSKK